MLRVLNVITGTRRVYERVYYIASKAADDVATQVSGVCCSSGMQCRAGSNFQCLTNTAVMYCRVWSVSVADCVKQHRTSWIRFDRLLPHLDCVVDTRLVWEP